MTCNHCGSPCVGDFCRACERRDRQQDLATDTEWYKCPECGGDAAAPDTTCFRCR